ncbi:hypothetical protein SSX86_013846 [Deinandra increscens subsp. villosa]|uniref:Reverse transcriptase zinc-binding domain-containing protein n=1 Tax=Deinandra increscens subsp. villosa TaxID=3103831 RepID=A0AAP0GX35_9ASTR
MRHLAHDFVYYSLVWFAHHNKLRTNVKISCPLCEAWPESVDHLFVCCAVASQVWVCISAWLRIPPFLGFTAIDVLESPWVLDGGKDKRKWIQAVILATFWSIWKARNEKVFRGKRQSVDQIVAYAKEWVEFWVKHRSAQVECG